MTEGKKWVFQSLVQNNDDLPGLLAYSFYKFNKDSLARQLRADQKSEQEIDERLEVFHELALNTPAQLEDYRRDAIYALDQLATKACEQLAENHKVELEKLKSKHNREITKLKELHKKEVRKAEEEKEKDIYEKLKNFQVRKKPFYKIVVWWLLSEIPKVFARVIVYILIIGLLVLFLPGLSGKVIDWTADYVKSKTKH